MKFYLGTTTPAHHDLVPAWIVRPTRWSDEHKCWLNREVGAFIKSAAYRLLRGTGLRLPRHGTKQLVEVEITAKKPRRK